MKEPIKMNIKQVKAQILLECPTCGSMKYVWVDVVDGIAPPIPDENITCNHQFSQKYENIFSELDGKIFEGHH